MPIDKRVADIAAVIMKDIVVVDEIQLGLAKEAGADGMLLMASVLGPSFDVGNLSQSCLLNRTGLIAECHTKNEVEHAISLVAQNIVVTNNDRFHGQYSSNQAVQLAGVFPGSWIGWVAGGGTCPSSRWDAWRDLSRPM